MAHHRRWRQALVRGTRLTLVAVGLAGCAAGPAHPGAARIVAGHDGGAPAIDAATAFALPGDYARRRLEASTAQADPKLPSVPGVRLGEFAGHRALLVDTADAKAAIALFGGHVLSFVPAGGRDLLWVSSASRPAPEPIRGGIPVIWPYFGREGQTADVPAHGLVRTLSWQVLEVRAEADGSVAIAMAPPALQGLPLALSMELRVGRVLEQRLVTRNTGAATVVFSQALHNYLRVGDADAVSVSGVDGLAYLDKNDDYRRDRQSGDWRLSDAPDPGRSDRIYRGGGGVYALDDPRLDRRIRLTVEGAGGLVIWNPGEAGAARAVDLRAMDWQGFVCVEPANLDVERVALAPGATHTLVQRLEEVGPLHERRGIEPPEPP